MLQIPQVNPAKSYGEALERVRALKALDDESILPEARTALLTHGDRTPQAVVLLHGFTNHPGQYVEFAPQVFETGANVLIPRLPEHGDKDRMTRRIARLRAEDLLATSTEAVDIARGLGDSVAVLGISSSGVLCAFFAQMRADVAQAVCVAPDFGLLQLPYGLSRVLGKAALVLPNSFLWWDPRIKEAIRPLTGYPKFSTRALAQTLRIADFVYDEARVRAPAGGGAATVCNLNDPAVNNRVTRHVVESWNAHRPGWAQFFTFDDLPHNHDIIDPENPRARTAVVYPKLSEFIRKV